VLTAVEWESDNWDYARLMVVWIVVASNG
jgi:hypothetical protein